jgi:TPR repeat protein
MSAFFNSGTPRGHRGSFALLTLVLFFSVSVGAATFEETFKKAGQGDARAQYDLGDMYFTGQGVAQNYAEAVKWLRLAADQGDADAQSRLGFMYARAQGVANGEAEAAKWFRKVADQGDARTQHGIGDLFAYGMGVAKDEAEAVKWYRKAADQGDARAQFSLGQMYEKGQGVAQNDVTASMWLILALSQTDPVSPKYHRVVEIRDALARKMTPSQIAEAQALAQEWQKQHR